jgi:hypothetical protein
VVVSRAAGGRGKDGMLRRFSIDAMGEISLLVDDFRKRPDPNKDATRFYRHFIGLKRFKDLAENHLEAKLPEGVMITGAAYRCTAHAEHGLQTLTLPFQRANSMEILHILAHYLQPSNSPFHGGEFGSIFLDLVDRAYGADTKRKVKDIMIEKRLKTFVKSDASREKQSAAYYNKVTAQVPQGLVDILKDLRESNLLKEDHGS